MSKLFWVTSGGRGNPPLAGRARALGFKVWRAIQLRKEAIMSRARRVAYCVLTGVGALTLASCNRPSLVGVYYPHAHNATFTETDDEHYHRVSQIANQDRQLLQDDLDLLFQTDRPTRLTRWHTR
jgi:hypothetical protein